MSERLIAYFTMEIALEAAIPTYSGGLGALAGDSIRAAADLRVPMVGVTLLYRQGYFDQQLDEEGNQLESPVDWSPEEHIEELPERALIHIEEREVSIRAWRYLVTGLGGHQVPVFFLDTDLEENDERDRRLTDRLYGGDDEYRLCQEVLLGKGGVRMLRALGYAEIDKFHMNEGHAALLTLELLEEAADRAGRREITAGDIEEVRRRCVFTTHTPVPAGHDQFPLELVQRILGPRTHVLDFEDVLCADLWSRIFQVDEAASGLRELVRRGVHLNMTYVALNLSSYVNGVAKKHGETSRLLFAGYGIDAITNGVHAATWTSEPFQALFDRHIPGWQGDNFSLRYALRIPAFEVWEAHQQAKEALFAAIAERTGVALDRQVLTLGFARRFTPYKRADLLFTDVNRLRGLDRYGGDLQIVFAGKAHPRDAEGKALIRRVFAARDELAPDIPVVYVPAYDTELARLLTSGVDVWLNTPQPPYEASGTSGMKAALNGVPSLSVLDGWWIEGHIEGVTGWAVDTRVDHTPAMEAESLYNQLGHRIMPCYYGDRQRFIDVMRHAIALNGSFFHTQRMMQQYVLRAYLR